MFVLVGGDVPDRRSVVDVEVVDDSELLEGGEGPVEGRLVDVGGDSADTRFELLDGGVVGPGEEALEDGQPGLSHAPPGVADLPQNRLEPLSALLGGERPRGAAGHPPTVDGPYTHCCESLAGIGSRACCEPPAAGVGRGPEEGAACTSPTVTSAPRPAPWARR